MLGDEQSGHFEAEDYRDADAEVGTSNVNTGQAMDVGTGSEHRVHKVVLRNLRKRSVAFGHVDPSAQPTNGDCLVLIDQILVPTEDLYDGVGTLGDISLTDMILWPRHSVTCDDPDF